MADIAVMGQKGQTQKSVLTVENLSVNFDYFEALKGVSFAIKPGEIVGVIGPNGAGKSTLVKSICGHQDISHGRINLGHSGTVPEDITPGLVGLVPQEIGLYTNLTASENLTFFAKAAGLRGAKAANAIDEALVAVDMSSHKHKTIRDLSGGMKRRINFAAAILSEPELLILDEPTVGVDAAASEALMALTAAQARKGSAVLLVSHELHHIEKLCERVLVLDAGKLIYAAPPSVILKAVFGQAKDLKVRFERSVSPALLEALNRTWLSYQPADQSWAGLCSGDPSAASRAIYALVESDGNAVRELTVRKPDLDSLIQTLVREKQA